MDNEHANLANLPTPVVSNVLSEVKNRLVGHYVHLSNTADTEDARHAAWREVLALDKQHSEARADDRTTMIELITTWGKRFRELKSAL
jgi:hypothetical protein